MPRVLPDAGIDAQGIQTHTHVMESVSSWDKGGLSMGESGWPGGEGAEGGKPQGRTYRRRRRRRRQGRKRNKKKNGTGMVAVNGRMGE